VAYTAPATSMLRRNEEEAAREVNYIPTRKY
jgi:hypothetical protein